MSVEAANVQLHVMEEEAPSYSPVCPPHPPVVLTWENLTVSSKETSSEVLLKGVHGTITGGLWAIMGPSGSGKTTLLSALAKRIDEQGMKVTGHVRLNGREYSKGVLKSMAGYVMQDDLVHAQLTVSETLHYTAELRMPGHTTREQRQARVDHLIGLLGLPLCRDVVVGDTRFKGISGGERKRVCIAIELMTAPLLLFLDEPTSGLDSAMAFSVVSTLHELVGRNECTVICTIHQPQSKIFRLFDNLILMNDGDIVYQGAASSALPYFESRGFPCPPQTNVADYLLDVLFLHNEAVDATSACKAGSKDPALQQRLLLPSKYSVPVDLDYGNTSPMPSLKDWQPWYRQFGILFRRCMRLHMRTYDIILMNIAVTVLVSIFVSMSVWRDIGTSKSSATKRMPALFFCVIHQGIVSSLQGTHSFPLERALMLRERAAGTYYVSAYFLAKSVSDFCVQVVAPVLFTCIVYPIVGFAPRTDAFFIFMAFMILGSQAATSSSNLVSCICVGIERSTVILAAVYEISRLYGGWFISPALMASYPAWSFADVLSYIKYTFVGVSLNEHEGLMLHCKPGERTPPFAPGPESPGNCKIPPLSPNFFPYSGHNLNVYYGYDHYTIGGCAAVLVAYIVGCRFLAYLGLRFIKH